MRQLSSSLRGVGTNRVEDDAILEAHAMPDALGGAAPIVRIRRDEELLGEIWMAPVAGGAKGRRPLADPVPHLDEHGGGRTAEGAPATGSPTLFRSRTMQQSPEPHVLRRLYPWYSSV
jgi:hypothetical protein